MKNTSNNSTGNTKTSNRSSTRGKLGAWLARIAVLQVIRAVFDWLGDQAEMIF